MFEVTEFQGDLELDDLTITGNTIQTNGEGNYRTTLKITVDEDLYEELAAGFVIQEEYVDDNKWNMDWVSYYIYGEASSSGDIDWKFEDYDGEVDMLSFTNEYTDYSYDIEIPLKKIVEKVGKDEPGEETFIFEIAVPESWEDEISKDSLQTVSHEGVTVTGNTIDTDGEKEYEGTLNIKVTDDALWDTGMSGGFFIREKEGDSEGWTYDDTVYYISPYGGSDDGGDVDVSLPKALSLSNGIDSAVSKVKSNLDDKGMQTQSVVVRPDYKWTIFKVVDFDDPDQNEVVDVASFTNTYDHESYIAKHKFVSGTDGKELPEEVTRLLPKDQEKLDDGSDVSPTDFETKEVKVDGGTWKFVGWDKDSVTINGDDVEFSGTWEFEKDSETTPDDTTETTPDDTTTTNDTDGNSGVETGDSNNLGFLMAILLLAAAGLVGVVAVRRRS